MLKVEEAIFHSSYSSPYHNFSMLCGSVKGNWSYGIETATDVFSIQSYNPAVKKKKK
jgi:hypothetical protein